MFNHRARCFVLSAVLLVSIPAAAFADSVQGRVANADSYFLDVTVYDTQGRPYPNTLHLKVDNLTQYYGVSSATMLRRNDPVGAEVSQETAGVWHADSVSLLQDTASVQRSPAPPSPSLAGALGNPVVRNGLLGAATGAIASSASGGKAGKGALIGAGVGILGGFFADKMSQPQQPRQQSVPVDDQNSRN